MDAQEGAVWAQTVLLLYSIALFLFYLVDFDRPSLAVAYELLGATLFAIIGTVVLLFAVRTWWRER